jgi:hypothetical protein
MFTYPKVLIPKNIKDVKTSLPRVTGEPIQPKNLRQKQQSADIYIYVSILLIIVIAIIGETLIHIPSFVILLSVIYFMRHLKIKDFNSSEQQKYNIEQKKYEKDLSEYYSREREAQNNPIIIKNHRKELLGVILKKTKKTNCTIVPQNGISESYFENYLKKYFKDRIFTNLGISESNFNTPPYQPDFTYICPETNLHIDIEIDEIYILKTGEPIHYRIDSYTRDDKRNNYFLNNNWVVIRFSEEQVIKYPDECCKVVAQTIFEVLNEPINNKLYSIGSLAKSKQWTKDEAKEMYRNNFRNNLLYEANLISSKTNYAYQTVNTNKSYFETSDPKKSNSYNKQSTPINTEEKKTKYIPPVVISRRPLTVKEIEEILKNPDNHSNLFPSMRR